MSSDRSYRGHNKINNNRKSRDFNICRDTEGMDWRRGVKVNQQYMKEEESRDIGLYVEYVQWDFINNVLYMISEKMLYITEKFKKEFTNTLQRWFIYINEHFNDVPKYLYYPILPNVNIDHKSAQFLRDAIVEKEFTSVDRADAVVAKILDLIQIKHADVTPHADSQSLRVKYNDSSNVIIIGKFRSPEIPRLELLVKKAGIIATAKMLLRYESFGNGSYQWGDPKEVHKNFYEKFNVRYEGFASPLSSRYIEYDDTHFCSLFPETDAVFGSLGNFFHVDMTKHIGGWSVNPPFLNDLMKAVAERIIAVLDDEYKGYFFCTFPCWEDDEAWRLLNQSKYLRKRFDLPKHFEIQDAYGRKLWPNMSRNIFIVGNLPNNVSKSMEMVNLFPDRVNGDGLR